MFEKYTEHIIHKLKDEISEANTYLDMAHRGSCMLQSDIVESILCIAKDEYSHAKFIYDYLHCMNAQIDDETCENYRKLECRMREY